MENGNCCRFDFQLEDYGGAEFFRGNLDRKDVSKYINVPHPFIAEIVQTWTETGFEDTIKSITSTIDNKPMAQFSETFFNKRFTKWNRFKLKPDFCTDERESLLHLFWSCKKTILFWKDWLVKNNVTVNNVILLVNLQ